MFTQTADSTSNVNMNDFYKNFTAANAASPWCSDAIDAVDLNFSLRAHLTTKNLKVFAPILELHFFVTDNDYPFAT